MNVKKFTSVKKYLNVNQMHTEITQMFVDSIWMFFKGIGMHFESMRMHSESIRMYFASTKMCSESMQLHFAIIHVCFVSMQMHFKNIRMQFEGTWIYNEAIRMHFERMTFHRFENVSLKLMYLTKRKKVKENLRLENFLIWFLLLNKDQLSAFFFHNLSLCWWYHSFHLSKNSEKLFQN